MCFRVTIMIIMMMKLCLKVPSCEDDGVMMLMMMMTRLRLNVLSYDYDEEVNETPPEVALV